MRSLVALTICGLLSGSGCGQSEEFEESGFRLHVGATGEASITTDREMPWWINTIAAAEYDGWSSEFDEDSWRPAESRVRLVVSQDGGGWPTARLQLGDSKEIELVWPENGAGWIGLHRSPLDEPVDLNLAELGLAPSDDPVFSRCQLSNARVLISQSEFPGEPVELRELADESAASKGKPAPQSWHQLVLEREMYDLLFFAHDTTYLSETTFAFLALNVDPVCGNQQVALRTEERLVGFVERVTAE